MAHRLLPRAALEVSPMTRCLRALLEIDERHKRQQTDAGEHKQISVGGGWNSLSRTRGFRRVSDFLFLVALILVISSLQEGFHRPPQSTAHACISAALGETFTWPGGGVAGVGALTHAPGQARASYRRFTPHQVRRPAGTEYSAVLSDLGRRTAARAVNVSPTNDRPPPNKNLVCPADNER